MAAESGGITGPIERPSLPACETRPVSVGLARHKTIGPEPLFDMHYALEMGVVLRGRMRRFYRKAQLDCAPGDVWFCGIWEPHGYRVLQAPCEAVVNVVWPSLLVNLYWPEAPGVYWMAPFVVPVADRPRVPAQRRDVLLAAAERVRAAREANGEFKAARLRLAFLELLLGVIEISPGPPAGETRSAGAYYRLTPALDLALQARRLITNEEAAQACALSRDRFIRLFRRLMGVSFARFALRHRLSGAAAQLTGTPDPIKAIARGWGFTDESHLHRLLARHYGCTPRAFRQRGGPFSPNAAEARDSKP
ncbi:MAG: helix-turn-helix transcriptional regulator [Kiritimatiellae bacterium]|nr:helix-turn-helix transcriptional regulator [Kiritimatiellia bacterium]